MRIRPDTATKKTCAESRNSLWLASFKNIFFTQRSYTWNGKYDISLASIGSNGKKKKYRAYLPKGILIINGQIPERFLLSRINKCGSETLPNGTRGPPRPAGKSRFFFSLSKIATYRYRYSRESLQSLFCLFRSWHMSSHFFPYSFCLFSVHLTWFMFCPSHIFFALDGSGCHILLIHTGTSCSSGM